MAAKKAIVITFGRFQPPTSGHGELFDYVNSVADKYDADALVFPSVSQDAKKNPLPFREKVQFLKSMFPTITFNGNSKVTNPWTAWEALGTAGYTHIYMCAAGERIADFKTMAKSFMKGAKNFPATRKIEKIEVLDSGERTAGISGTAMRGHAAKGDFKKFAAGVGTRNQALVKQLYNSLRKHMDLSEAIVHPKAFLLYGIAPAVVESISLQVPCDQLHADDVLRQSALTRNIMEMRDPFIVDVSKQSYVDIKHIHGLAERAGYAPTIYLRGRTTGPMNEAWIKSAMTSGLIQQGLARDVVVLEAISVEQLYAALKEMLREAETKTAQVKTPSEVDRLKDQQKQQMVLTKQRQAQELLQAKQRELAKKSREDMNKIKSGDKPSAITR